MTTNISCIHSTVCCKERLASGIHSKAGKVAVHKVSQCVIDSLVLLFPFEQYDPLSHC